MNNIILIGRLTRDIELRFIAGGDKAVANFSIAVDRPFSKDKAADFFNIVVWGKQAENCAKYLAKGSKVAVKGYLYNESWEKDGIKRQQTKVNADQVEYLDTKKKEGTMEQQGYTAIDDMEDIPF